MRRKERNGFTMVELLIGMACFTIVSGILLMAANAIWNRKFAADDTMQSYENTRHVFEGVDSVVADIGIGMVSSRYRIKDDGTYQNKPTDEFRISWLGGSWAKSPPPAKMMADRFDEAGPGDIGAGPVTVVRDANGSDELWFAYGLPTGVKVTGVSRNRKIEGIGNERVPLSSAYMDHSAIKDAGHSSYGGERYAKYMYLRGYWNDGSDSVVLTVDNIGVLQGRYGLKGVGGGGGGPDDYYKPDVVNTFAFVENRMSVLQEVHPVLYGNLESLNSWLLLSNVRFPLAIDSVHGNRIVAKPAPGAYFYKQIMSGSAPAWNYTTATGELIGGPIGVGSNVYMPRMGHIKLVKTVHADRQATSELLFESCPRVSSGSCDPSEPGYHKRVIGTGLAAILWSYDPGTKRLSATVAGIGKEGGAAVAGVPTTWPKERTDAFTADEKDRRLFVRNKSWTLATY